MAYFTLFVFAYVQWCPTHIVLCFCFFPLHLVWPVLSVSLDCPFLIAPSLFSYVYYGVFNNVFFCGHIVLNVVETSWFCAYRLSERSYICPVFEKEHKFSRFYYSWWRDIIVYHMILICVYLTVLIMYMFTPKGVWRHTTQHNIIQIVN